MRFIQPIALEERLAAEAKSLRLEAAAMPPSLQREALLRKARQREAAADTTAWLSSPELHIGARVRLTELGKSRSPRIRIHTGSIVGLPQQGKKSVQVLFDGNRVPTRLHLSYIELCSA